VCLTPRALAPTCRAAKKHSQKEFQLCIRTSDMAFERGLSTFSSGPLPQPIRVRRRAPARPSLARSLPLSPVALALLHPPSAPLWSWQAVRSDSDLSRAATHHAHQTAQSTLSGGGSSLAVGGSSVAAPAPAASTGWFASMWQAVVGGGDGDGGGSSGRSPGSECVLVAQTPFEVDAWASAIRETKGALVSAAQHQEWDQVRVLARVGRDVNTRAPGNQRTALHYAAGYGDVATARALVNSGAHVNVRDRAGMTPLGWACLKGHLEVAQLLLKSNADPLIKAHSGVLVGKTAVTLARLHGTQNLQSSHKARSLVHVLLLHCGAACYQVHHILGQGGFGRVIEVTRADTGDAFAMKSILKQGSSNQTTNAKVVHQAQVERRILSRISHPFIIDLHCAFQTSDKLLLVLELCPGGDLKQHMSRSGRFPPEVAAFVAAQVLMALEYLHARQIVHRDIKLENVLLDAEGYVRVTDFNVAKVMEERRTYSMKGTLFCMAPEVILKKGHDAAADFWSFAVLIFEMVTGGPPFFSNDKQELKRRILGIDPHHVSLFFPPDVPTSCRMLLSQLFVRDPKHRLGARRQDMALLKAHPFFGRLNWERLYAKQLPSPLRHSVEALMHSRANGNSQRKHALNSTDQDMAPSYLSQQHSALVQGWDYVANPQ